MTKEFATRTVHFDRINQENIQSKVTPIYQTTAFTFKDLEDLESFYNGERAYLYSRNGNPNTDELGRAIAQLEEAQDGVAVSSGLGAILVGVLAVAKSGDHIVAADDLYGGTIDLFQNELKYFGIEISFADFSDPSDIEAVIQKNTVLLYSESITNPLLRVENLQKLVELADKFSLKTMIDNTFATPYLVQPYTLGIDLVIHSATKYIGGHSDVTAGTVAGSSDLIEKVRRKAVLLGTTLSPFEAWLALRGVKTLDVRMERQVTNAQKVADFFRKHAHVATVYYPEFVSDKGNGAIVTVDFTGHIDINQFFKALSWVKIIPTLAGVETTVSYPKTTSHRALTEENRDQLGIREGLVRISIGLENADDIIEEFDQAITAAKEINDK
jgi:cystathionine gamma-synthase